MKVVEAWVVDGKKEVAEKNTKHFVGLLNEESQIKQFVDRTMFTELTKIVERIEIEIALKEIKRSKAVGPDNIPVEVGMALGKEEIDILWDLMRKNENQKVILEEWQKKCNRPPF